MVLEPGLTPLEQYEMLTEEQYVQAVEEYGEDSFRAGIGAEALKELLSQIDLEKEATEMRAELQSTKSEARRKKVVKRLKIVEAFLESGSKPEWMVMDVIPVIPPELRPLVLLDGGRFATSDLNDLRMLQEAVDALFDNGRGGRAITGTNKRPLKSLAEAFIRVLDDKSGLKNRKLMFFCCFLENDFICILKIFSIDKRGV